ncbi:MAG: sigma-54-dependent Fis family transcriptional regulator [Deltaproteobacteria bacterium]|nr:sigma-54-dependent Fis family transcriptional regulator [Deltaproteobacteria bacterium]MBZ0219557.1 sigma-54 dependent transcriptional regulator [Deltaproteobacteria bacterium]
MQKIEILLIEDSDPDARLLKEMLADSGSGERFILTRALSLAEAMERLSERQPDVALMDLNLPDSSGLSTFLALQSAYPALPVVLLTGLSDENLAARAVREGAQDYLIKGQVEPGNMARSIIYAVERSLSERAVRSGKKGDTPPQSLCPEMVSESAAIAEVKSLIAIISKTSSTSVLITGETGTGKELVANAIHYSSSRREGPFIKLNCSAIPDTLMEAEMFGYEKGAFTDARQSKKGLFELADGGTIFLDEIGDMDLRLQPKLLQVLENRTFRKLGGVQDQRVDVRVIAATNLNLGNMVKEKRFREDLFYRLNVMAVSLPPLRERKEDIVPIVRHFLKENGAGPGNRQKRLKDGATDLLLGYDWPGNIRELKNVIERALILAGQDDIGPEHLNISAPAPHYAENPPLVEGYSSEMTLEELEKAHIRTVLERTGWNITHASRTLGVSRFTLREKAKKYGFSKE